MHEVFTSTRSHASTAALPLAYMFSISIFYHIKRIIQVGAPTQRRAGVQSLRDSRIARETEHQYRCSAEADDEREKEKSANESR